MAALKLDTVSDQLIEAEYHRRFSIQPGTEVNNSDIAARHFTGMLSGNTGKECFAVIFLNGCNKFIAGEIMFKGTLTKAGVFPREIAKRSLEMNAAAIICAHNHPSGNLRPSREDIDVTARIKAALKTVDVALHDHLIIAGAGKCSFADDGLL
ncbi:MAG: JAB domain-containing protein [Candidatus Neomarinimicrobiota bacterium]